MFRMLTEERTQFQKEQDDLLKTVLNLRFFNPWSYDMWDEYALTNDANLEIYITNVCNLKCEYCYLQKYPKLYPEHLRDPELLLHNLSLLYDYILDQNFHIPKVEFFSGEIWHTKLGWDILELTLQYLKKGMHIDWFLIASNCSFVSNNTALYKIQHYIDEFKNINNQLVFSISVDGEIIEQKNRPAKNGEERPDDFWDMIFIFAKHNNFFFHPMISAKSSFNWIENLKWWYEKLAEYEMPDDSIMMLEVRNDDWTDQSLEAYLKYLDYEIERYLHKDCNDNLELFYKNLLNIRDSSPNSLHGYINWAIPKTDTFLGCTVATDLTVRLGDLAICPCHRTAYDKYLYGHFVVVDDKIVDITANNPNMAIKVLMNNIEIANFGCDTCIYNSYCLKGCLGSQYESTGDPWIPIPNVCRFFKTKYNFLLSKYEKLGVFEYCKTISPLELNYPEVAQMLQLYNNWKPLKDKGDIYVLGEN